MTKLNKNTNIKKESNILQDELLRCRAEFDNYRKRMEKDRQNVIAFANIELISNLLPVLDNFKRATYHSSDIDDKYANWVGGILAIQKQLEGVLNQEGLEQITTNAGDDFNPVIHEAIAHEKNNLPENKIIGEVESGYLLKGKLIRAPKVKVSSGNK